jgi:hypothetical protein
MNTSCLLPTSRPTYAYSHDSTSISEEVPEGYRDCLSLYKYHCFCKILLPKASHKGSLDSSETGRLLLVLRQSIAKSHVHTNIEKDKE